MASAAYQYLSDDGTLYQAVLSSDFALQMGYNVATGSEPFLPEWISYRYATYQSSNGLFINSVAVTNPFNGSNPPAFIQVSGVTYSLKSSYGEQRGVPLIPGLFVIAGPPGANGVGLPLSVYTASQPTSGSLSGTAFTDVCSISLPPGSYLLFGGITGSSASGNAEGEVRFNNDTDGVTIGGTAIQTAPATGTPITVTTFGTVTINATKTIALQARTANNTNTLVYQSTGGPGMMAVKYA